MRARRLECSIEKTIVSCSGCNIAKTEPTFRHFYVDYVSKSGSEATWRCVTLLVFLSLWEQERPSINGNGVRNSLSSHAESSLTSFGGSCVSCNFSLVIASFITLAFLKEPCETAYVAAGGNNGC